MRIHEGSIHPSDFGGPPESMLDRVAPLHPVAPLGLIVSANLEAPLSPGVPLDLVVSMDRAAPFSWHYKTHMVPLDQLDT